MRVARARFENNHRMLVGTGKSIIEVDFRPAWEAGLRKIGALGRNGSGKSTLLSSLHPLPEAGDDFAVLTPGKSAEKRIEYVLHDGTVVESVIQWPKSGGSPTCRLYVNGEVLHSTAKGNVTDHAAACEAVLRFHSEIMKITRIQNRVDSFLEMKAGQRKDYVSMFMPELADWATMNGNSSKRVTAAKNELRGLTTEMNKMQPAEELAEARSASAAQRDSARASVAAADQAVGSADAEMESVWRRRDEAVARAGGDASSTDFNPFRQQIEQAEADLHAASATVLSLHRSEYLKVFTEEGPTRERAAEMRGQLQGSEAALASATQLRARARATVDRLIRAIEEGAASLQRADGAEAEIETLTSQAALARQEADALRAELEQMRVSAPEGVDFQLFVRANEAAAAVAAQLSELRSWFDSSDFLDEAASLQFDQRTLSARADESKKIAAAAKVKVDTAESRISRLRAEVDLLKRVGGAEAHCSNPKCPFEIKIAPMKEAAAELAAKEAEQVHLVKKVDDANARAASWARAAQGAAAVHRAFGTMSKYRSQFAAVGAGQLASPEGFFALLSMPDARAKETLDFSAVAEAMRVRADMKNASLQAEQAERRIADLQTLLAARASIAAQAEALATEREGAEAEVVEQDAAVAQHEREANSFRGAVKALEVLADGLASQAAARQRIEALRAGDAEVEVARSEWESAKARSAEARDARAAAAQSLEAAEATLAEVDARLARRRDYEARADEVQGRLRRSAWVADASHPTKGAPIHFIRDYLTQTRVHANEMLDLAMGGEFRLGFEVNEKEFRIPVYRPGTVIPDVRGTSDGQAALAKVVLSLALVKQAIQGTDSYDIITLDEIDGALDLERNKEQFVRILDRLVADLGLEQLFFVSHNEYLHAEPAGLILFPGHSMPVNDRSFIGNKVVLADFS